MKTLLSALLSLTLVFSTLGVAVAQETDEDALFGGDSVFQEEEETTDEAGTNDDDSLFGGGGELFTDVEETADTDPSAALLESGTTLGGQVVHAERTYRHCGAAAKAKPKTPQKRATPRATPPPVESGGGEDG